MGGGSTTTVNTPPPTAEEKQLTALNAQLAQKQLDNINALQPYQQQLLQSAQEQLSQQTAYDQALQQAGVTPEAQAAYQKQQLDLAQQLGPLQEQLIQKQIDQLNQGPGATPEQKAAIAKATDAAIAAGNAGIDANTQRGIGLIADQLANSRGLRLSDSPITSEAALLAREGETQKGLLQSNLRSAQANAELSYPLAVEQLQSGINQNQQQITNAASQFQARLQQQAFQNRMALTGQTSQTGIGLASLGNSSDALRALTASRLSNTSTNSSRGVSLSDVGSFAAGIGALAAFSDERLKEDVVPVAKLPSETKVYSYRMKGSPRREIGVLAQEIGRKVRDAVLPSEGGFLGVDYAKVA